MKVFLLPLSCLVLSLLGDVAHAAAVATGPCINEPCVETFESSCSDLLRSLDFAGCCSLADDDNTNVTGGCVMTVSNGTCSTTTRPNLFCEVFNDGNETTLGCLPGTVTYYESNSTDPCPASNYDLPPSSASGFVPDATLTMAGIPEEMWSDEIVQAWGDAVTSHMEEYYETNSCLNVHDLIVAQVQVQSLEPQFPSATVVTYSHSLSWRSPANIPVDEYFIAEEPFATQYGQEMFLAALQKNSSFFENASFANPSNKTGVPCNGDTNEDPQSAPTSAAAFLASANNFMALAAFWVVSCFYF